MLKYYNAFGSFLNDVNEASMHQNCVRSQSWSIRQVCWFRVHTDSNKSTVSMQAIFTKSGACHYDEHQVTI